jgi:hypothetical protein
MQIFFFQGIVHEMNKFFEGLKNQISTFCVCADSFKKILLLVIKKIKDTVSFGLLL